MAPPRTYSKAGDFLSSVFFFGAAFLAGCFFAADFFAGEDFLFVITSMISNESDMRYV